MIPTDEATLLALVGELTGHNRHATAMWLVARHFGFADLCREFAAVGADWKRRRQLSDESNARMHTAFKEMRQRIVAQFGAERWAQIRL